MTPRLEQAIDAFRAAGRDLGVVIVAPFELNLDGRNYRFLAFLPHFGGPKGVVIAEMDSDRALYGVAEKAGYYISFVNADAYSKYDRGHFVDTLRDWGFYGSVEQRPHWWNDVAGS
jgi:hypothetical protein